MTLGRHIPVQLDLPGKFMQPLIRLRTEQHILDSYYFPELFHIPDVKPGANL